MKKLLLYALLLVPYITSADDSMQSQMLDAQIEMLEQEYSEKLSALQQCEKQTKGFKIAGITTLALTDVGIYANIKLAEQLKKTSGGSGGNGGPASPTDNRPQSDKDCEGARDLLSLGLATQQEVDETCGNT